MALATTFALLIAATGPATGWALAGIGPAEAETKSQPAPPMKIARYASRLMQRYDTDGNGHLSRAEWGLMQGRPAVMDRDQDGQITLAEMILHIREYARYRKLGYSNPSGQTGLTAPIPPNPASPVPIAHNPEQNAANASDTLVMTSEKNDSTGAVTATTEKPGFEHPDAPYYVPARLRPSNLPAWFVQRDRNGDGQLSLAEFAPSDSREAVLTFQRLDASQDGLLTPQEAAGPKQPKQPAPNQPAPEPAGP